MVEMIMSRTLRPSWMVPADGDTLLRQAIVVDHSFERAAHNIQVLAVWTDQRGVFPRHGRAPITRR